MNPDRILKKRTAPSAALAFAAFLLRYADTYGENGNGIVLVPSRVVPGACTVRWPEGPHGWAMSVVAGRLIGARLFPAHITAPGPFPKGLRGARWHATVVNAQALMFYPSDHG